MCTEELLNYTSQNLSILSLTDVEVTGREKEVVWAVGELDAVVLCPGDLWARCQQIAG